MTENEAIKELSYDNTAYGGRCTEEVRRVAIHALSEIQQYRAIGTVESLKNLPNICDSLAESSMKAENLIEELTKYRAIGTIEELQALKEKNVAKKPREWANGTMHCPNEDCEFDNTCLGYDVCVKCGQRLDWQ